MRIIALSVILAALAGCATAGPVAGDVVTCARDEFSDPTLINDVTTALQQPDWRAAVTSLIAPAVGRTASVIACVLRSIVTRAKASPGGVRGPVPERAQIYLDERGVKFRE
jgi:hypothetical protein